jgi:hypothetical protein
MANGDNFKEGLRQIVGFVRENAASLSPEVKSRFAQFLKTTTERLSQAEQKASTEIPIESETIPDTARLLWVAAGGDVNAFVQFLGTYPDRQLNNIKRNPQAILHIIKTLSKEIPKGIPTSSGGVASSWLPSSNVWGFGYDKNTGKMRVKFNGKNMRDAGPTYEYDNVPPEIAAIVGSGGIPAKTTGKNKWGTWWTSKNPSIGSSVNALLKNGGFSYRKISG